MNTHAIIGTFTRDPEMKYTASGTAVCNFSLAYNKSYTQGGEKKEKVSYFDFQAWSKTAEVITEYCHKGDKIAVTSEPEQQRWDAEDGTKRSKVIFTVQRFDFVSTKKNDSMPDI